MLERVPQGTAAEQTRRRKVVPRWAKPRVGLRAKLGEGVASARRARRGRAARQPFTTATGRRRATFLAMPARLTVSTT